MNHASSDSSSGTSAAESAMKAPANRTHLEQFRRLTTQSRRRVETRCGFGRCPVDGGRGCSRASDNRGRDVTWCRMRWRRRWSSARVPRGWRRWRTRWGSSRTCAAAEFYGEYLYTQTHTQTHTHTHAQIDKHRHTYKHRHRHTYRHTYSIQQNVCNSGILQGVSVHTDTHTDAQIDKHRHTYKHTRTHTHTHIQTQIQYPTECVQQRNSARTICTEITHTFNGTLWSCR